MIISLEEYHSLISTLLEVQNDEAEIVKVLSEFSDGNIFKENINDISLLTFACLENLPTLVKVLLEKGANPNLLDKRSLSALGVAILCANFEITKLIFLFELKKSIIKNNDNSNQNSPQKTDESEKKNDEPENINLFPVFNRSIDILKIDLTRLLRFAKKISIQKEFFYNSVASYLKNLPESERINICKFTSYMNCAPLFQCANRSLYSQVKFFLDNGVNINTINSDLTSSYTLLSQAVANNDVGLVDILLKYPTIITDLFYDQEAEETVESPLEIAIKKENSVIAEKLLKAGANPEGLLSMIKQTKKYQILEYLLENTIKKADDPIQINNELVAKSTTFLHLFAKDSFFYRNLDHILKNKGHEILIDVFDSKGMTPLFYACAFNNEKAVRKFLELDADPSLSCGLKKETPIISACIAGHLEIIKVILNQYPELIDHLIEADQNNKQKLIPKHTIQYERVIQLLQLRYKQFHAINDSNLIKHKNKKNKKKSHYQNSSTFYNKSSNKNNAINLQAVPHLEQALENKAIKPGRYFKENYSTEEAQQFISHSSTIKNTQLAGNTSSNHDQKQNSTPEKPINWLNGKFTSSMSGIRYIDNNDFPNCFSYIDESSDELQGVDLVKFKEVASCFCPPFGKQGIKSISNMGLTIIPTLEGEEKPLERILKDGKITNQFPLNYEMKILGDRGNERLYGFYISSDCGKYTLIVFSCHDANSHATKTIKGKYNNKQIVFNLPPVPTELNINENNHSEEIDSTKNSDDTNYGLRRH